MVFLVLSAITRRQIVERLISIGLPSKSVPKLGGQRRGRQKTVVSFGLKLILLYGKRLDVLRSNAAGEVCILKLERNPRRRLVASPVL